MPCNAKLKRGQTAAQRSKEVKEIIKNIEANLAAGNAKAIVDRKTGAIAFAGIPETTRDGITDACIYRQIVASGSALARAALARAEALAGRNVSRQAVAAGLHSHDGGTTWHNGH